LQLRTNDEKAAALPLRTLFCDDTMSIDLITHLLSLVSIAKVVFLLKCGHTHEHRHKVADTADPLLNASAYIPPARAGAVLAPPLFGEWRNRVSKKCGSHQKNCRSFV